MAHRRAPCLQENPPQQQRQDADPVGPGPYIDLSNPAQPKLVGTLPAELEAFGRVLLAQAADAANTRTAGEPAVPTLTTLAALVEKRQQPDAATQTSPSISALDRLQHSPGAEPALISSGQYRTREENRLEIAHMTRHAAPPPGPRAVKYDVRRDWLGRTERWYNAEEISRHRSPTDLWLTAHGKVYDVTEWVEMHPGGSAALLGRGGRDATRDLDFHSEKARAMWEATCIGRLDDGRGGGLWVSLLAGWLGS